MVGFGKNKLITIKLSKEEQSCILQYCEDLPLATRNKITHMTDGTIYLMGGEADFLFAILCNIPDEIKNEYITTLFDGLLKRIPLSDDILKHTEKYANQDCTDPDVSKRIWDEIEEEKKTRPDPNRGNLTPQQITRFQEYHWGDAEFPLQFNHNLSIDEVNQSLFFRNTKLFLNKVMEYQNTSILTVKGNLNRNFVKTMFDEMELDEEYKEFKVKHHKVLNEQDVRPLHIIKVVCKAAGLIEQHSKKFIMPEKYHFLLSDENSGELYYRLFDAYFNRFNLAYLDRRLEMEGIQGTIDFSFYSIYRLCDEYQTVEDMFYEAFLPSIINEIEESITSRYDRKEGYLTSRVIRPLEDFGLVECKFKRKKFLKCIEQVKKTPLFDKFMSLNL